jgi:hypothetical protein
MDFEMWLAYILKEYMPAIFYTSCVWKKLPVAGL